MSAVLRFEVTVEVVLRIVAELLPLLGWQYTAALVAAGVLNRALRQQPARDGTACVALIVLVLLLVC